MSGIFTRNALRDILNDENLTAEEKAGQIFSLHGQAIDVGFVSKKAAETLKSEAVAEALQNAPKPDPADPKESEEYKALQAEFNGYKARQEARRSDDYKGVKSKFFDAVYDKVDRGETAKPIAEQLADLRKDYEEYFDAVVEEDQPDPPPSPKPQFGAPTQGGAPQGKQQSSFADGWGFVKNHKKE